MSKRVFLDNASTTPMAPEIIEMMCEMMKTNFANPSSVHSFGRESKIIVENARKTVADLLHTSPGNIFFNFSKTGKSPAMVREIIGPASNIRYFILIFSPGILIPYVLYI